MTDPAWCESDGQGVILRLRLAPRASSTGIAEVSRDRLRVRVSAPPVDNAANRALCAWLAKEFRIPASQVSVVSGAHAREKRVRVREPRAVPEWLDRARR